MIANTIMAVASVLNLILVIVFSFKGFDFQKKINDDNKLFQSMLYNLNINAYWMHEVILKEFQQSLYNFEKQSIDLINEVKDDRIYLQFTPILKSFMEDMRFFDILSVDLRHKIRELVIDLEDVITDVNITEKNRCMEIRKTKINIINLIYNNDCELHKLK